MQETFLILGSIYFLIGSLWFIATIVGAIFVGKQLAKAEQRLAEKFEPVDDLVHRLKNPVSLLPFIPVARFLLKRARRFLR